MTKENFEKEFVKGILYPKDSIFEDRDFVEDLVLLGYVPISLRIVDNDTEDSKDVICMDFEALLEGKILDLPNGSPFALRAAVQEVLGKTSNKPVKELGSSILPGDLVAFTDKSTGLIIEIDGKLYISHKDFTRELSGFDITSGKDLKFTQNIAYIVRPDEINAVVGVEEFRRGTLVKRYLAQKTVFVGVSLQADKSNLTTLTRILESQGKKVITYDTNLSLSENNKLLREADEHIIITASLSRPAITIGKGLYNQIAERSSAGRSTFVYAYNEYPPVLSAHVVNLKDNVNYALAYIGE